jgi:hypothetical protein
VSSAYQIITRQKILLNIFLPFFFGLLLYFIEIQFPVIYLIFLFIR